MRCEALLLTVDTAHLGRRERDVRRGMVLPPKLGLGTLFDGMRRPSWTWNFLRNEPNGIQSVADTMLAQEHGLDAACADAVMLGRPYLYALAAAGEPGVDWLIDFLWSGMRRTMALSGETATKSLDRELLSGV